jgi:hypothetical protein
MMQLDSPEGYEINWTRFSSPSCLYVACCICVFLFLSRERVNDDVNRSLIAILEGREFWQFEERNKNGKFKGTHGCHGDSIHERIIFYFWKMLCVFSSFLLPGRNKISNLLVYVRYIYWPINFVGLLVNWLNIIPPGFYFIFPLLISWSKRWVSCTWRRTCYTAMSAQGRSSSPDEVPGNWPVSNLQVPSFLVSSFYFYFPTLVSPSFSPGWLYSSYHF